MLLRQIWTVEIYRELLSGSHM